MSRQCCNCLPQKRKLLNRFSSTAFYERQLCGIRLRSVKLDLIEGNTLFIDGSKFRANASINNTWTDTRCEARLEKISKNIAYHF